MNGWNTKMRYAPTSVRNLERIAFFVTFSLVIQFAVQVNPAYADFATTTASISICGNGITDGAEVCDDGAGNNTAAYASSTATRSCAANCRSFGPYCGDGILQAYYGEECDDGNNIAGDFCSPICKQEEPPISSTTPPTPPPTPSGNGGSTGAVPIRAQTQVLFAGKAYPNTRVQILKDGELVGMAQADSNADFSYTVANATPGPTTFGFWAEDNKKIRSITYTTTFQVTQNAVTNVGNVFLPPTIRALVKRVAPGSEIALDGTTVPKSTVQVLVDKSGIPAISAASDASGEWKAALPTTGMTPEIYHSIFPFLELSFASGTLQQKSGNGTALLVFVGNNNVSDHAISPDINHDGKVNMVDFSMLLFRWGGSDSIADLNTDGKVNIADLSIMLFAWTG